MRHFRNRLRHEGITVHYHQMTEQGREERGEGFAVVLRQDIARLRPRRLILVRPGDYRVLTSLEKAAAGLPVELRQDSHFTAPWLSFWLSPKERGGFCSRASTDPCGRSIGFS